MAEVEIHNKTGKRNGDGSPIEEVKNDGKVVAQIRNKESIFGNETNQDGSPVKEVIYDGVVVAEIHNKESIFGNDTNEDGSPVQEIIKKN